MQFMSRLAAVLLTVGAMAAASTTPASADLAYCDQQCQWQWDQQQQNALPRTDFYDAPDPLQPAPAGTLIRQQDTSEFRVAGAPVTATRILYHSRTSAGRDVAASGVVLVPAGTAPASGWPVVVNAHGTSGSGVNCAPSLMRDLYHGDQMMQFVERGWAVVAPDYAGLGTTGQDEFLNKTAESNDLINAARAARQALPGLSDQWVLWGHSQGGGAALGVAERQADTPEPGYLGAVVTSPAADLPAAVASVVATPGMGGFVPLITEGAEVTDPQIDLGRVLSPKALSRLSFTRTGCLGVVMSVYSGLSGTDLVRPNYLSEPHFAKYLDENTTGRRPVGGPVLLLQGDADHAIPRSITDHVAATLCQLGSQVDYRTYPGLGHDTYPGVTGIDDGAMPDILAWTADRLAGRPATSTCS
ncbi:alpha-beta hydrolase superfamily lysophospholipase [Nonomuraea muscovyensis]|uniref:Alpha-beta hydrolase superfamily lysophospholipase n=1 Tax=Nonomuraea muscovyensis TaxID=1124761 RepID=A0A7X0C201_9ACTN|nr:alpha/beta fold hydrolase [Nonomuraea muscovyensis]MBB6347079.1 alpha-beta hydrolase superfamily lysophospholipase [Nonomuraea muscovyensis]